MISQTQSLLSIDGSLGEGDRQVLRTSLTLGLITGRPFTVTNIRSRRPKSGLMAQYLKAAPNAASMDWERSASQAERVADEATNEFLGFLATDGVIDPYLADQLVLPLALALGVSEIRTSKVTQHLTTNAEIVKMFLPVGIEIEGEIGQYSSIRIRRTESFA